MTKECFPTYEQLFKGWEEMQTQRDHWLEIAREKDQEIERLTREIRALDQANGQAVRENERLQHDLSRALANHSADLTTDEPFEPLAQIESLRLDIMAVCKQHGLDAGRFIVDYVQNSAPPAETLLQHTHEGNQTAGGADSPDEGYSQAYADQMRTALIRISTSSSLDEIAKLAFNGLNDQPVKSECSLPTDCSGDPSSCPDNEGTGCFCSRFLATTDCKRSHPHEDMNEECQQLTLIARASQRTNV
jgi:hypothetical protein